MIIEVELGKTSYGGEVLGLDATKYFEIPALRCVISTGRLGKNEVTIEEAIDHFNKNSEDAKKLVNRIYGNYRHLSIGEVSNTGVYLKGVSRLLNFIGWAPIGGVRGLQGVGTEKSLRRTKPGDFIDIENSELRKLNKKTFETYESKLEKYEEKEKKEMMQYLRYVLLLSTSTEEIIQIPSGRELGKWANYFEKISYSKEAREVGKVLKEWNNETTGIEIEELPYHENFMPLKDSEKCLSRKTLENKLKVGDIHYDSSYETVTMRISGSNTSFHQEIRDRQEDIRWPSWESVVLNDNFMFPLKKRDEKLALIEVYDQSQALGKEMWAKGDYEAAILSQPLGKEMDVISMIHGNPNIKYTFMLRTCNKAQEEIRKRFLEAAQKIQPLFGEKLGPRCEVEGKCYEWSRETCEKFQKYFEA